MKGDFCFPFQYVYISGSFIMKKHIFNFKKGNNNVFEEIPKDPLVDVMKLL